MYIPLSPFFSARILLVKAWCGCHTSLHVCIRLVLVLHTQQCHLHNALFSGAEMWALLLILFDCLSTMLTPWSSVSCGCDLLRQSNLPRQCCRCWRVTSIEGELDSWFYHTVLQKGLSYEVKNDKTCFFSFDVEDLKFRPQGLKCQKCNPMIRLAIIIPEPNGRKKFPMALNYTTSV
jgi:hypothetical protein